MSRGLQNREQRRAGWRSILWVGLVILAACGTPAAPEGELITDTEEQARGLRIREPEYDPGYVLFAPLVSGITYLIDGDGQVVHTWETDYAPMGTVQLLENGNLLRGAKEPGEQRYSGGGAGGRLQELTWDGELVWEFVMADDTALNHHDYELLPNGNILLIAWEGKTIQEAQMAGRRPEILPEKGLWPDKIVEIEPTPPSGGKVVWEWHAWDHLIQDTDPNRPNYGNPADKPWRIDINAAGGEQEIDPEELDRLKALGYVPDDTDAADVSADMFHTNAVAYNAELDQIALSTPAFSEIWIIDHSTTTEEAAGSTGGRYGRGGDLLYRWGNPKNYGRGTDENRKLYYQHDVRWVRPGLPGEGHLTLFNNALPLPGGEEGTYSSIFEIAPPIQADGTYELSESAAFGPSEPVWKYEAADKKSFSSGFISGAERLANGNTIICSGADGRFFEVTPDGKIVWEYWNLYSGNIKEGQPVGNATYAVFRVSKLAADHPGLAGKSLEPLDPQPAPIERSVEEDNEGQ